MTPIKSQLIHLARADPNVFVEYTLGMRQAQLHIDMQQALSDNDDLYFELPRGHGKTTQIGARLAWEIGHDPETLISVVQATYDDSTAIVSMVRDVIESERFREVFPEIEPDRRHWGAESLKVKRRSIGVKDPTLAAQPIFGNAGKRTKILVFDDISNLENAIRQPAKRDQVKDAYRNTWLPTCVKDGRRWRIGTPWHVDDVSALWRADKSIKVLRYPCDGTKESPWPEMFSSDRLQLLREQMGSTAYARAYGLVPMSSDEQVFFPGSMRAAFYDYNDYAAEERRASKFQHCKVVVVVDLAFTSDDQVSSKKSEPDYSVIMVGLVTPDGHGYPIHLWRRKERFTEVLLELYKTCHLYKADHLVIEEVAAMKGINQIIEQNVTCPVVKLKRNRDKYSRAIEQQSIVEQGRLHIPMNAATREPIDAFVPAFREMEEFPFSRHDDCVDVMVDFMGRLGREATTEGVALALNPNALDPYLVANHMEERKAGPDDNYPNLRYDDETDIGKWLEDARFA